MNPHFDTTPTSRSGLRGGRRAALVSIAALALAATSLTAVAQTFPDRPITMIVPFPAGGTTDILGRLIAQKMSEELKQTVIVDNRAGAGGNIGAAAVASASPDGYTLLMSSAGPLSINQHLYKKQGYDPLVNFVGVSYVADVPIMLVSNPKRPFKTVAELAAYAKANPGKLSYGSQGNGTTSHLTMEMLKRRLGVDIVHVPYRGSAPASSDLIGGQIDLMFDNSPSTYPYVKAGQMHGLGVASGKRVPGLGPIPAIAETVPGFESTAWFGIVAPAGTPPAIVSTLNSAVNAALKQADMKERMDKLGVQLIGGTPADMQRQMTSESAKWGGVVKEIGLRLD